MIDDKNNTGDSNSGYSNNGYSNSGDCNGGDYNGGDSNSGDWNSGNCNGGDSNSGNSNSGDSNSGDWNSGDWNGGYRNSGYWNSGNWNSGFFNNKTPEDILVFGKSCKRTVWSKAYKPEFLFFELCYWIAESEMTDEDKKNDPDFHIRSGQLRKREYKEAWQHSWDNSDKEDREKVRDLPNFDAEIFYDITGIDLR